MKHKAILILDQFFPSYEKAIAPQKNEGILHLYRQLVEEQLDHPFVFEPYHKKIRNPIDYYKFGLDFIRPLVDIEHSTVHGMDVLEQIDAQIKENENVIFLANHQTETDPQALSILLEKTHPQIGENVIYVAGERVITDPLAIPFSMGCDLLCIYSKRYIDYPPEQKAQKQTHNQRTMQRMSELLQEGGKIVYVAPSGGRDRAGNEGEIEIAPFDPQSIEMFMLMARKAKTPTHFYPLTLATHDLLPPPETVQKELGEMRTAKRCPIHIAFAPEFDMEHFPGSEVSDKLEYRKARALALWKIVKTNYEKMA